MYVAGALGVFAGALAMYVGFSEVINEQYGRTVFPLG
jgi:succinate-acetate transporter protein